MFQFEYKGRFYSRLPLVDENGVLIEYTGLTKNEVMDINKQHDWADIRNKRDSLIAETDWTQYQDSPLSVEKKAEFAAYRQALRDLPQSTDNPDEIVWPVKP